MVSSRVTVALALMANVSLYGQVCRLSVAGLNRARRVVGNIHAECPEVVHTAPFGNWGVTSNFGSKNNTHQFDGWCHDTRVCDNAGPALRTAPMAGMSGTVAPTIPCSARPIAACSTPQTAPNRSPRPVSTSTGRSTSMCRFAAPSTQEAPGFPTREAAMT